MSMTLEEAADRVAIRELIDAYAHCAAAQPGGARTGPRRSEPLRRDDAFQRTEHSHDLRRRGHRRESYCLAHHVSVEGDEHTIMIAAIRYEDTFARLDGTWLFSERRLYVDWTDTRPISSRR
jgi:hypothetical protein